MIRVLVFWCLMAGAAFAVQPDEILDDAELEARARDISSGLRCLVCRNESIDESNAGLARDLRILVRERLLAGDSDQEAVDYIVNRYGEYVLLKPQGNGVNLILWLTGPAMFLGALLVAAGYLRRQKTTPDVLSDDEQARLDELLNDRG